MGRLVERRKWTDKDSENAKNDQIFEHIEKE